MLRAGAQGELERHSFPSVKHVLDIVTEKQLENVEAASRRTLDRLRGRNDITGDAAEYYEDIERALARLCINACPVTNTAGKSSFHNWYCTRLKLVVALKPPPSVEVYFVESRLGLGVAQISYLHDTKLGMAAEVRSNLPEVSEPRNLLII